jgi:hypothetical protein
MNPHIAKLAEQAAQESFDPENDTALEVSDDEVSYQIPEGFIQRFAELIVQDCVNIANTAEPYQSADLIQKHFGVES